MNDLILLGVVVFFFVATAALVIICQRLMKV
jgi:hypothetical protein